MEGIKAYTTYQALKLHFTSKYDYIKYNGKIKKITEETFMKRKDIYFFRKIERKYKDEELVNFFVSNFVSDNGLSWVGEMSGIESEKIYAAWKKRIESFSYITKQELLDISDDTEGLNKLLNSINGEHPPLLKYYFAKRVSPETLLAFDASFNLFEIWDRKIDDDIIWSDVSSFLKKYRPFVKVDVPSIKKIIRDVF